MIRVLYEFGYIHEKIKQDPNARLDMTDITNEILKSRELQRCLYYMSLSDMSNLRKDSKNVYFRLMGIT